MSVKLTIILMIVTETLSQICNYQNSVELTNRTYNGIKYEDSEYYVDNSTGLERGCVCLKELCARKCCPFGQGYDQINKKCVDVSDDFNPPVWNENTLVPDFNINKEFHFLFYKMNCSAESGEARIPIGSAALFFHLLTNGDLYVEIEEGLTKTYGADKYCIDNFVSVNSESNESSVSMNALVCYAVEPDENHYGLSSTCMLISCFFIILTVAVYAWLPELRNLHGLVLMAYLLSFFVGFLFLATLQILIMTNNVQSSVCTSFTYIIYYALLSAFFWLNVMCYDIWWTFSGKRAMSSSPSSPIRRFMSYAVYAFGVPLLLTILLAVLEYTVPYIKSRFLPRLRQQGCFLYGHSKFIYLYIPIIVLCVANLIFFTLTAIKIAEIKKQTQLLNKKDKQRFSLYIKLFIVMGVNWILEVISSFYPKANYIWQFTDAYNVLVGVIIFIIFVCKGKTWRRIKDRIKFCSWSNSKSGEMRERNTDMSNKNISRWQTSKGIRASIDTIRTILGNDMDTKSARSEKSNHPSTR